MHACSRKARLLCVKITPYQNLSQAFSSPVIREGLIDEEHKRIAAIFSFQQAPHAQRQRISREQMRSAQQSQQPSHACGWLIEVNHTG